MRVSRYVPLLAAIGLAAAACEPAAEPAIGPSSLVFGGDVAGPVVCPSSEPSKAAGTIGPLGGLIGNGPVQLVVPAGALLQETRFEVTVPESPFVEVDIKANGQDHFRFQRPVIVSMDYSHCARMPLTASVWYYDESTRALLEKMGSVNDVLGRRIIFSTVHLSGYIIAN